MLNLVLSRHIILLLSCGISEAYMRALLSNGETSLMHSLHCFQGHFWPGMLFFPTEVFLLIAHSARNANCITT
jgi:hypothetical protein